MLPEMLMEYIQLVLFELYEAMTLPGQPGLDLARNLTLTAKLSRCHRLLNRSLCTCGPVCGLAVPALHRILCELVPHIIVINDDLNFCALNRLRNQLFILRNHGR